MQIRYPRPGIGSMRVRIGRFDPVPNAYGEAAGEHRARGLVLGPMPHPALYTCNACMRPRGGSAAPAARWHDHVHWITSRHARSSGASQLSRGSCAMAITRATAPATVRLWLCTKLFVDSCERRSHECRAVGTARTADQTITTTCASRAGRATKSAARQWHGAARHRVH